MPEKLHPSLCPSCPEIKRKIGRIDLALFGEDGIGLNGGNVKSITDLQAPRVRQVLQNPSQLVLSC
jgi:hypothetical protein